MSWLTPGTKVVALTGRDNRPSEELTIERVLKRDIVLSNGDRWSQTGLAPNGEHITRRGVDVWAGSDALFPADHPRVAAAQAAAARRTLEYRAGSAAHDCVDAVRRRDWQAAWASARKAADLLEELSGGAA